MAAKRETGGMEKESRDQDETLRPVNKIAGLARVAEDRGVRGGKDPQPPGQTRYAGGTQR